MSGNPCTAASAAQTFRDEPGRDAGDVGEPGQERRREKVDDGAAERGADGRGEHGVQARAKAAQRQPSDEDVGNDEEEGRLREAPGERGE
ncbi:MAG: hypothetical protein AUH85_00575 [Chloroflexi bacterium 13_1_40CM_4_68_4]|nr:MAG: hypothetical protein AUH85_00575 [Chloroflexi bacterium 13_1_40CM_4_68_4]